MKRKVHRKHSAPKRRRRVMHHSAPKRRRRRSASAFSGMGFGSIGKKDAMQAELTNFSANIVLRIVNSVLFGTSSKAGLIPGITSADPLKKNAVLYLIINFFGAKLGKNKIMTGVQEIVRTRLSDAVIDKFAPNVDFLANDFKGDGVTDIYQDESGKKFLMVNGQPIALSGEFDDEIAGNDVHYGGNDVAYGEDSSLMAYTY